MTAIHVENIKKTYDKTVALKGVSMEVQPGEIFGLIGPDGAGKTSLIRILTTLLLADSGQASVQGLDVVKDYKKIRHIVGYMPGRFSLYQDLTVLENLNFFATIFGATIEENYHLIEDIYSQIEPFKDRKAGQLSGGMKQKLALSCALVHQPEVLFLDEPTTGVDAVSRQEFWEMLKRLHERNITIFVSTPYMDEASLCDRVALIQEGEIMKIDTPQGIVDDFKMPLWAVRTDNTYQLILDLREWEMTHTAFPFGDAVHLTTPDGTDATLIREYLENKGHSVKRVEPIEASVEDCFMELMHGRVK